MPPKTIARQDSVLLTFVALLAVLALGAALPTAASAELWHASLRWEPPTQPPSLQTEPPTTHGKPYLRMFDLTYDDNAGVVTATFGYYEPTYWQTWLQKCESESELPWHSIADCAGEDEGFSLGSTCSESQLYGETSWRAGRISLAGYNGSIEATAIFDGTNYTIVFSAAQFAKQEVGCLSVGDSTVGSMTAPIVGSASPPPPSKQPRITVHRATENQLRSLARVATVHHSGGFDAKHYRLSHGKITNDGWATAIWGHIQPETLVFHETHSKWRVVTWGSAVCEAGQQKIPSMICRALNL